MSTNCKGCPLDDCPILLCSKTLTARVKRWSAAGYYVCWECQNSSVDKDGIVHASNCSIGHLNEALYLFERGKVAEAIELVNNARETNHG